MFPWQLRTRGSPSALTAFENIDPSFYSWLHTHTHTRKTHTHTHSHLCTDHHRHHHHPALVFITISQAQNSKRVLDDKWAKDSCLCSLICWKGKAAICLDLLFEPPLASITRFHVSSLQTPIFEVFLFSHAPRQRVLVSFSCSFSFMWDHRTFQRVQKLCYWQRSLRPEDLSPPASVTKRFQD